MLTHNAFGYQRKAPCSGEMGRAASLQRAAPFDVMPLVEDPALEVRQPARDEIEPMLARASTEIGAPLASNAAVRSILAHDPQSVWLFLRAGRPIGTFALLFLNRAGVAALRADRLDLRAPSLELLAEADERPCGIYFWAMLARGRAAAGVSRVFRLLRTGRYAAVDLWALPYTADGRRFADRLGFEPVPDAGQGGLMCCKRWQLPGEKAV